jgi:hypothetical protein
MISRISLRFAAAMLLTLSLCAGCATTVPTPRADSGPPPALPDPPPAPPAPPPEPTTLTIPIVVKPKVRELVPKGSRIVIADIEGYCDEEVKTALMKRLVDNADYSVVTRDNLNQIIGEADQSWTGKFNTDTAAKLGDLMGASLWIVGHVSHCGQTAREKSDGESETEYKIIAVLQVIDIATGKVLVASASEGVYSPRYIVPLELERTKMVGDAPGGSEKGPSQAQPGDEVESQDSAAISGEVRAVTGAPEASAVAADLIGQSPAAPYVTPLSRLKGRDSSDVTDEAPQTRTIRRSDGSKVNAVRETEDFAVMRAADDLASDFADKFFGRPLWETVVMWDHAPWRYSEAAVLVQLGQCPLAVRQMDEVASLELLPMTEQDIARYLHNFGVALLCANEPERAAEKLRSAYRISRDQLTLEMLGLVGKILEWSLAVEVDRQPEIQMLIKRDLSIRGR